MVASMSLDASVEQRHARSGFRVLVVGRAVAVVVESRDLFRAEARGVPPDGVGAVLVPVLGVPYQVSLGHVEALRFGPRRPRSAARSRGRRRRPGSPAIWA